MPDPETFYREFLIERMPVSVARELFASVQTFNQTRFQGAAKGSIGFESFEVTATKHGLTVKLYFRRTNKVFQRWKSVYTINGHRLKYTCFEYRNFSRIVRKLARMHHRYRRRRNNTKFSKPQS